MKRFENFLFFLFPIFSLMSMYVLSTQHAEHFNPYFCMLSSIHRAPNKNFLLSENNPNG